jgi:hypothetical protein
VLTAVARTVAADEGTDGAIVEPLSSSGAAILPELPNGPVVTGPILWVRDAYGSHFGVMAAFSTLEGADRWYRWDVDACGYRPFAVRGGYYATGSRR